MKPAHLIVLLALNVVWAATLSIYKVLEPELSPGGIVTLRCTLGALSLVVFWPWLPGRALRGRELLVAGALGLAVFALGHRLQVWGNQLSTASNSSVLMAVEPLIASVAAAIFLHEHIGPRRMAGFFLGMTGVALLNGVWREDFRWVSLGASAIFISSFVCETAFSIGGKKILRPDIPGGNFSRDASKNLEGSEPSRSGPGPLKFLGVALAAGTLANLLLDGRSTLNAAAHLSVQAWLLLLILAVICTSFGYGFWLLVIRESDVNVVALTIFMQPVSGVLIARLWLGEALHWGHLWGSAAIILGLMIGLSRQVHPRVQT